MRWVSGVTEADPRIELSTLSWPTWKRCRPDSDLVPGFPRKVTASCTTPQDLPYCIRQRVMGADSACSSANINIFLFWHALGFFPLKILLVLQHSDILADIQKPQGSVAQPRIYSSWTWFYKEAQRVNANTIYVMSLYLTHDVTYCINLMWLFSLIYLDLLLPKGRIGALWAGA